MAQSPTKPQASEWGDEIAAGILIKWDAAKVLIGTFEKGEVVTSGQYATPEKPSYRAIFTLEDGETASTFCPSALASRLQQVPPGSRVRIEYDGTTSKSKSGRDVKNFSVRVSKNGHTAPAAPFDPDAIPF